MSEPNVIACPNPFTMERVALYIREGENLGEFIKAQVPRAEEMNALVYLDEKLISKDEWDSTFVQGGQTLTVRVIPSGGSGGKNTLRTVLSIAVMATAWMAAGPVAGQLGRWFGGIGKWVGHVGMRGVGMAGVYAVNQLVPIPEPTTDPTEGRVYSITGQNNRINRYGPIPKIFGKMKVYPPLAALPFTVIEGNDQWMY